MATKAIPMSHEIEPNVAVLSLNADLDSRCTEALLPQIRTYVHDGYPVVILDLTNVRYISMMALANFAERVIAEGLGKYLTCRTENNWISHLFAGLNHHAGA